MISVILSTFQRPKRLKKAIKSVLNQSFTDFELLVVDDKSKDETKDVVGAFHDPRIRFLEMERHFGCDTRPKNRGIMESRGEYIAFLDDDNEFRPDHLLILHKELIKNEQIDVVYGDRWLIDETKKIPSQIGIAMDFKTDMLIQRNFIDTSDVLVRRKALFDVGGFDERYKKYIDWNLWVRLMKFGKHFNRVPVIITDYHLHNDMKSVKVKTKGDSQFTFVPEWEPHDCDVVVPYLGNELVEPRIAIYSITYGRLDYTKKSFKSLHETAGFPFDHFVVDNGSKDGTKEWLLQQHALGKIKRIRLNEKNEGISKASNDAITMIKRCNSYDCIVKWDNDCIGLTKGWLAKMVELWKASRKIALSCYVQGLVDNPGGAPRIAYGTLKGEPIGLTKHLGGICHFVDAHAYDTFTWDNNAFLHGIQDMEFSQYLQFHGFTQGYLENYYVSHGPKGTAQQKMDYTEYFNRRSKEKQTRYAENG